MFSLEFIESHTALWEKSVCTIERERTSFNLQCYPLNSLREEQFPKICPVPVGDKVPAEQSHQEGVTDVAFCFWYHHSIVVLNSEAFCCPVKSLPKFSR